MLAKLVLIHHEKKHGHSESVQVPAFWFSWETCLRKISLGWANFGEGADPFPGSGISVFQGDAAYRFLLEVITGLHSPVIGETEVLGQFRSHAEAFLLASPDPNTGAKFRRLLQRLYKDAKLIRESFFQNAGSQSYGSLARKYLRGAGSVQVIGAGHLVLEILPWLLAEGRKVEVFCREPARAQAIREKCPSVAVRALEEYSALASEHRAVVVAAPLPSKEISSLLGNEFSLGDYALDFRADSAEDRLPFPGHLCTLADIFQEMEANNGALRSQADAAKIEIARLASQHLQRVEHRPFGWEDVCA